MSKYIIELNDDCNMVLQICITEHGNSYIESAYAENLEELNSDYINEHFGELQDQAYQKGLEEGKTERGCKGCEYEAKQGEHLPCDYCMNNFKNQWTAKDDKIKVGDVVIGTVGSNGIVTNSDDEDKAYVVWDDGSCGPIERKALTKAGRHFDIQSILEDMRHD